MGQDALYEVGTLGVFSVKYFFSLKDPFMQNRFMLIFLKDFFIPFWRGLSVLIVYFSNMSMTDLFISLIFLSWSFFSFWYFYSRSSIFLSISSKSFFPFSFTLSTFCSKWKVMIYLSYCWHWATHFFLSSQKLSTCLAHSASKTRNRRLCPHSSYCFTRMWCFYY